MLRDNQVPESGEALVDMSQYSIESGRNSIQKQYENLVIEREILKKRKLELEKWLIGYKIRTPSGLSPSAEKIERKKVIEEITEIQKRLMEIKPNMTKLHSRIHRDNAVILEDILAVLKQIAERMETK